MLSLNVLKEISIIAAEKFLFCIININLKKVLNFPFSNSHFQFPIFAEFPTCVAENSAHAGSVILDCILSLDSGFSYDNSALHVPFCDLSTLLQSNPRVKNLLFKNLGLKT